jgi:hypothetical protein
MNQINALIDTALTAATYVEGVTALLAVGTAIAEADSTQGINWAGFRAAEARIDAMLRARIDAGNATAWAEREAGSVDPYNI